MGGLSGRLRKLERELDAETIAVEHEDGTTSRFQEDAVMDAFLHEMERGRRHHFGEEPGEAHPFIVALRSATNMDALMAEQGTVVGLLLGEDMIMRGEIERPGPPVEWNEEGTVCS
jgi:hypothetical protein